jgi:pyruvate formate lyase activating enzyme
MTKGKVHSFQSLGTIDGPGIRFVVFLQGCNLRCGCCHNPDTWPLSDGNEFSPEEVISRVKRYTEYFGQDGGITISGGEPLLQPEFVKELFTLCKAEGINTCLDTSGSILNDKVKDALSVTDRVLLDVKYTSDELYRKYVGCSFEKPLEFLRYLNEKNIPVTLRQVTIPTLNDNEENIESLKKIIKAHPCIDGYELLPFRKICQVKYDQLGKEFAFSHIPEPDPQTMANLKKLLEQ